MTADQLLARHPILYHMVDARNRDNVRRHGLLSTTALLDAFGLTGDDRAAVESRHRPATVRIPFGDVPHPTLGFAHVRDQRPLDPFALAGCLTDRWTVGQWYRTLNARVYLWPTRDRLDRMLKIYTPDRPQVVLAIDAAALLRRHGDRVELSHINSGFASRRYPPAKRGPGTFVSLAGYPWSRQNEVAEVTVRHAVADVLACVVGATLEGAGTSERLSGV